MKSPGRVRVSWTISQETVEEELGPGLGRGLEPQLAGISVSESEQMAEAVLTDPPLQVTPPSERFQQGACARCAGSKEANDRMKLVLMFWYFFQYLLWQRLLCQTLAIHDENHSLGLGKATGAPKGSNSLWALSTSKNEAWCVSSHHPGFQRTKELDPDT